MVLNDLANSMTDKYVFRISGQRSIVVDQAETCFHEISICNMSIISQPIIMKFDMHIPG